MKTYTADELRDLLHKNVVKFSFFKADKTRRDAIGTLMADKLPAYEETEEQAAKAAAFRANNPDTVTYWDLEANGFRRVKVTDLIHESVTPQGGA